MGLSPGTKTKRQARGSRKVVSKPIQRRTTTYKERATIQVLGELDWPPAEIARYLNIHLNSVRRWVGREGQEIIHTPREVCVDPAAAKALVCEKRFASAAKAAGHFVNPKTGENPSGRTVCRALIRAGCINKRVRKTSLLTALHKKNRKTFCRFHRDEDWEAWLFSDEKWFCVGGVQGNERMWVHKDDPNPAALYVPKAAKPQKVMVWGCISYEGRSALHFHDESVNSQVYQECIEDCLLPSLFEEEWMGLDKDEEYIFHQDGASCHMSNSTAGYLETALPENINFTGRGEWPANSPDLNPIERLWAILQDRVVQRLAYSEEELIKVVEEEWWAIPQSTIKALYDGMDGRVARCRAADGGRFALHEK